MQKPYIHETAEVQSQCIGNNTKIWQYVVILPEATIGDDVNIDAYCFIGNKVLIGNRVSINPGARLLEGICIDDDVFIGPNVTFANDQFSSKVFPKQYLETRIEKRVSIGAGAVILPGIIIGTGAMIGAGAIVTTSVPPFAVVTGGTTTISHYLTSSLPFEYKKNNLKTAVSLGVGKATLHYFNIIQDSRGELSVGEFLKEIPFSPKRYFLVFNVPEGKIRGGHAHHKCHQFLICIKGQCSVVVDDGNSRTEVRLDHPSNGIYLPPLTWGTQYNYSTDAVLLVFTSDYYEEEDYVRDYHEFCELVQNT